MQYIFALLFSFLVFFWLRHVACGILVPQPGIEPVPPAAEAQSPNRWTAREVPHLIFLTLKFIVLPYHDSGLAFVIGTPMFQSEVTDF